MSVYAYHGCFSLHVCLMAHNFDICNISFTLVDKDDAKTGSSVLVSLFEKIYNAVRALSAEKNCITIVIDDIALMEVVANGSSDSILDFLHYCHTLTSEFVRHWAAITMHFLLAQYLYSFCNYLLFHLSQDCSVVALNHGDIYSSMEKPMLMLNLEYLSNILVRAEPLATGSAVDVHGQVFLCWSKPVMLYLNEVLLVAENMTCLLNRFCFLVMIVK